MYILILLVLSCGIGTINNRSIEKDYYNNGQIKYEVQKFNDKIENLEWLRFHYAHPAHLNRKMIHRYSTLQRLIPYIDMPVQHGSEKMLNPVQNVISQSRKTKDACG